MEILFKEIRLFLLYFVEFSKDNSILVKNYLNNCAIRKLDQRLIIIISYNRSKFLAYNRDQKI